MRETKIIAIDGLDGSGKTTQFEILNRMMTEQGKKVLTASFPAYEGFFGIEIGRMLAGKTDMRADELDAKSMALWYACDRLNWYKSVCLDDYDYVLLNRYSLSNAVYQGARATEGQSGEFITWITELEHTVFKLPEPDLYFIFDISPEVSRQNVSKKGNRNYVGNGADIYESSKPLMVKVRQLYLKIAESRRDICVINTVANGVMLPAEMIHRAVVSELSARGLYGGNNDKALK